MKKTAMKFLSVFLCLLMVISVLTPSTIAVGGETTTTAYITPSKIGNYVKVANKAPAGGTMVPVGIYPKGVHFDESGTPYWSFNYSNTQIFTEFDLADYAGKDIKKVEIIFATSYQEYNHSRYMRLYDIIGNWTVSGATSVIPTYDSTVLFLEKYGFKVTEANRAKYPENIFDYKYAQGYDITEFILGEISEGKTSTDFACWLDYNVQRIEEVGLFVEYVDNTVPLVEFKLDKTDYSDDENIVLKASASDKDNDAIEVTFTVDVSSPVDAVYDNGYYVYEYSSGEIAKGRHTVKVTATDIKGSSSTDTVEITVGRPSVGENTAPKIILLPEDEYPSLSKAYIPFAVKDAEYDKVENVAATLDGTDVDVIEYTGGDYAASIPANLLNEGSHELVIIAKDIWGTSSTQTFLLEAGGNPRLYAVSEPTKLGNYVPSTEGIYTRSKKPVNSNLYISGGLSDQLILSEYDLSDYIDLQVEKVELLINPKGAMYKSRHATIYEILSDWEITNVEGHGRPVFSENAIAKDFARVTYNDTENLTDIGYPEVAAGYKYAIDMTEFALGKLADNEPVFDFVIIGDNGRIGGLDFGILVTYRDNTTPVIETEINADNPFEEGIEIIIDVTDEDGIDELTAEFDGIIVPTVKSGATYTANITSDKIFGSAHKLTVRAVDKLGAVSYKTESIYFSVSERVSPASKGIVSSDKRVSAATDKNTVNKDTCLIEKFYIANLDGKNIEGAELSISDVNVYTTSDEWNISSETPELTKITSLAQALENSLENGDDYLTLAINTDTSKSVSGFSLDVVYVENDAWVADRVEKIPVLGYSGVYLKSSVGKVTVDVSDNHIINYLNYPYAIIVHDGTETLVETKKLDFSDRHSVKISVSGLKNAEAVVFTPTAAISNKPTKIELSEYVNGIYKGDSADFAAEAFGALTAFSNESEFTLDGAESDGTFITEDGNLTVANDETANYLRVRAENKRYPSLTAYRDVRVLDAPTEFDEDNVVLKVGVLSDIHLYGTYDAQQPTKFRNALKTMQKIVGGEDELDALLISGDITQNLSYGDDTVTPASAYTQVTNFRNSMLEVLSDDTLVLYALGNHDSDGDGTTDQTAYTNIPRYFVNVLSGVFNYTETGYTEADEEYNLLDPEDGETYERFYAHDIDMSDSGIYYGNRHAVYNGYHFIAVEPTGGYSDIYYTAETRLWLKEHLEMAASDAPDRPIFVITHTKLQDTTKASEPGRDQMSADITPILDDYPQVFLWTGHTHNALSRVNAIMQGGFTALEGSTTQGIAITGDRHPFESGTTWNPDPTMKGKYLTGQGQVLELDKHGNMRITKFDTVKSYNEEYSTKFVVKDPKYSHSLAEIDTPWIINDIGADGAHLYAYDNSRKAANTAPYFDSAATLTARDTAEGIEIEFDAATDDEGSVALYVVRSYNKETGEYTDLQLNSTFMWYPDAEDMPDSYNWIMSELEGVAGDYYFEVYAYDDWDAVSKPLTLTPSGEVDLEILSQTRTADGYSVVVETSNNTGNRVSGLAVEIGVGEQGSANVVISDLMLEPGVSQTYTVLIDSETDGLKAFAAVKLADVVGDADGDGEVTSIDLITLVRNLANWTGYGDDTISIEALDFNDDGVVTTLDGVILARHLADWIGYEEIPMN